MKNKRKLHTNLQNKKQLKLAHKKIQGITIASKTFKFQL